MVKITYVSSKGKEQTVDAAPGFSLMETAIINGVEEIDADCGGNCYCGTCRVYVVEEVLSFEGSLKASKRLAKRSMTVGGVEIKVGTQVVTALKAASRDPRRWDDPQEFILKRPRIKEHLAFARGAHTCIGAALTRYETRIFFEKLLEHTSNIRISEEYHGTPGNRRLEYEPSHSLRGPSSLYLELDPA
jgi:cytochrome P450